ncbi:MAG: type II toxin-antitoxin system PemK/MazF family toxin [Gracilimonas sp.]|nr:type II toxin-antitoxin system PemK/MazF family toxin [Gracilimonas sp.]
MSPYNYNKGDDVVVMFVTSNLEAEPKLGDYAIKEWKKAGFPKPSMTRMKFATIDKNLIIMKFAKLTGTDISSIKTELKEFLGF